MIVDFEKWPRKTIYQHFTYISDPFYNVCFHVDVSEIYRYAKRHGLSFYYCVVWVVTQAINRVDAFHYTMREGALHYIEKRNPSFTDMRKNSECFHIVTMDIEEDMKSFVKHAKENSEKQDFFLDYSNESDELIYITCFPTLDMTAFTDTHNYNDPNYANDSIPRIAWGQYQIQEEKKIMNLSMGVNHRFIDGYHIGQFEQAFRMITEQLKEK